MRSLSLSPLTEGFGAEVSGVDLRRAPTADELAFIERAMTDYSVVVFHDQHITDEQQLDFTRHFGPLLAGANTTKTDAMRLDPYFADVSNVGADGELLDAADRRRMFAFGNRLWHTDASFRTVPARYSILSGRTVPSAGGNTEFADMRAAYDNLGPAERAEADGLVAEHSLMYSREKLGFFDFTEEEVESMRPVRHPLVRTHPISGRRSLYLSAHIGTIVGWPRAEALAYLADLIDAATSCGNVLRHSWTAGDVVMWDNRQTMHRGRRFDDTGAVRDLRRTTTLAFESGDVDQVIEVALSS